MIPLYQISIEVQEYEGVPRVTFDLFRKGPPPFGLDATWPFDIYIGGADAMDGGLRPELLRVKDLEARRTICSEAFTAAEVVAIRKWLVNDGAKELVAKAATAMPDQPPVPAADQLLDAMAIGAGDWWVSNSSAIIVRSLSRAWREEPISEHGFNQQAIPMEEDGEHLLESGELWAVVDLDAARHGFDTEIDEAMRVAYLALRNPTPAPVLDFEIPDRGDVTDLQMAQLVLRKAYRIWGATPGANDGRVTIELGQLVAFIAFYTATDEDLIEPRLRERFTGDLVAVPNQIVRASPNPHVLEVVDDETREVVFRICCGGDLAWMPVREES